MEAALSLCIGIVQEIVKAVEGDAANTEEAMSLKTTVNKIGENLANLSSSNQKRITHLEDLHVVLESTKEYIKNFGKKSNGIFKNMYRMAKHRTYHARFEQLKEVSIFVILPP